MKILYIHTYYKERGGEDVVFEAEEAKMKLNGATVKSLIFNNVDYTFFKVLFYHFNIFSYFRVIKNIKLFKPDVIHIHNIHFAASPAVIWAAKLYKIPVVMTLHNYRLICPSGILYHNGELFLDSIKGNFPWKAVKNRVYKNSFILSFWLASSMWLHKTLGTWKKIKQFILLTEFSKNIYLQADIGILEQQITVKPNFITYKKRKPELEKAGFVYVGRLTEEKGIDTIIQAFEKAPFELTIVGDGPMFKKVQAFTKANHQVKYLGFQDNLAVQEILQSTDALLFTSKSFEGMPITIIEALANGTPVIAASLGSIPDLITDQYNGLLFKPGDANDLSAKINYWRNLETEVKKTFYKHASETYQSMFSPEIINPKVLDIYNRAIT